MNEDFECDSDPTISFEKSREVDRVAIQQWGMSGLVLMENAGRGVAGRLFDLYPNQTFLILCGKGNNGGDGFVIARHLDCLGARASLLMMAAVEDLSHDAAVNAKIALQAGIPAQLVTAKDELPHHRFTECDVIIDCLLGTGIQGPLRPPYLEWIQAANQSASTKVAVDVPSGWPIGDGLPQIALEADRTFTFVAKKHGMNTSHAARWLGIVEVVSIGVPHALLHQLGISTTGPEIN